MAHSLRTTPSLSDAESVKVSHRPKNIKTMIISHPSGLEKYIPGCDTS